MIIKIQQPENSVERVGTGVIVNLYNAHINGDISQELNEDNQKIGLVGSITADGGYENQVSTLNSAYPKLHINVLKSYIEFRDPKVFNILKNTYNLGDGYGISTSDLDGLYLDGNGNNGGITFKNTDIEYFEEFKYFTNYTGGQNSPFSGCTNLKLIAFDSTYRGSDFFPNVSCDFIIPSLKWFVEINLGARYMFPTNSNNNVNIYIGNTNNKLTDVVITSDMTPVNGGGGRKFGRININNVTWESNTDIPDDFFRTSTMTTLTVTGNISSVGSNSCSECNSLTTVTLPQSCITLSADAFNNRYGILNSISAPGVISVGQNCFYSAGNLVSADFISNLQTIGADAFAYCSNLQISDLSMSNLVSLGAGSFQNCMKLETISNLGLITEIPQGAFYNCQNLRSVVLPKTLKTGGGAGFINTKVQKLIYPYGFTSTTDNLCRGITGQFLQYMQFPSTLTSLRLNDMYRESGNYINCYIVIQATTPPSTNYNSSDTGGFGLGWSWGNPSLARWYVPDSVVNTYKTNEQWSAIADYIFPISQLETDSPTNWELYQANKDYGIS